MKSTNTTQQLPTNAGDGTDGGTDAVFFSYDIPESATYRTAKGTEEPLPNPSRTLRGIAARFNLSVWIVPASHAPVAQRLRDFYERHGCDAFCVAVRALNKQDIAAIARRGLRKEVDRIRQTIDETIAKERAKLEQAAQETDKTKRDAAARGACYEQERAIKEAFRGLEEAETCAALFDVSGEIDDLVVALRATLKTRDAAAQQDRAAAQIPPTRTRKTQGAIRTPDDLIAFVESREKGIGSNAQAAAQQTIPTTPAPTPTPAPIAVQKTPQALPLYPTQRTPNPYAAAVTASTTSAPLAPSRPVDVRSLPLLPEPDATRGKPIAGLDDVDPLAALAALDE